MMKRFSVEARPKIEDFKRPSSVASTYTGGVKLKTVKRKSGAGDTSLSIITQQDVAGTEVNSKKCKYYLNRSSSFCSEK